MYEALKFAGAAAWLVGIVMFFVNTPVGLVLILFAAVMSGVSLMKGARDRELRRESK